jgi:hypothetical protein
MNLLAIVVLIVGLMGLSGSIVWYMNMTEPIKTVGTFYPDESKSDYQNCVDRLVQEQKDIGSSPHIESIERGCHINFPNDTKTTNEGLNK